MNLIDQLTYVGKNRHGQRSLTLNIRKKSIGKNRICFIANLFYESHELCLFSIHLIDAPMISIIKAQHFTFCLYRNCQERLRRLKDSDAEY